MEGWSSNQLELLNALAQLVAKVGDDGAAGESAFLFIRLVINVLCYV